MPKSLSIKLDLRAAAAGRLLVPKRRTEAVVGSEAVYRIKAESLGGADDGMALETSGLPSGAVGTFDQGTIYPTGPTGETSLRVNTTGVAPGAYGFKVNAVGAGENDYDWILVDNAFRLSPYWSDAGVWYGGVKGIPTYPVGITMQCTDSGAPYYLNPNGTTDCKAAIQAAVTACAAYHCVLLPAGDFALYSNVALKTGVSVRGAGVGVTTIIKFGTNAGFTANGTLSQSYTTAVSGYTRGSATVQVSDASIFAVGDIIRMDELNEPTTHITGAFGTSTWCGRFGVNGTRALGENRVVTSINGNYITFDHGLNYSYNASYTPQLGREYRTYPQLAGVEDLSMEAQDNTVRGGDFIRYEGTRYCWVKNVDIKWITNSGILFNYDCLSAEVRDCYLHDATIYDSARGTGIRLSGGSNDCLVENNTVYFCHDSLLLDSGATGNVIGYNFITRMWEHDTDFLVMSPDFHGPHCMFNLIEGNESPKMQSDNGFGSSSHNTLFRNRMSLINDVAVAYYRNALVLDGYAYHYSAIGNILSYPGYAGCVVEQIPFLSASTISCWKVGYNCCGSTGNPTDTNVAATLLKHGNWEGPNETCQWTGSIASHDIPDSLYLTAKPSWFGAVAWPPFAPERAGFDMNNVPIIPARARWGVR